MQICTIFNMTPKKYLEQFKSLTFSKPDKCHNCGGRHSFHSHGCYWRNIITDTYEERIPVARLCCKFCNQTVSLLPSFALPYFQYSLDFILKALSIIFKTNSTSLVKLSPLFYFYRRRFYHNLRRIEMFFRDQGWLGIGPSEEKEKAKEMVCMLTFPKDETFSQKFHKHNKRHFMAH